MFPRAFKDCSVSLQGRSVYLGLEESEVRILRDARKTARKVKQMWGTHGEFSTIVGSFQSFLADHGFN